MPRMSGYNNMFKAGKGNGEQNLSGAKALVEALAKKGIKAQRGTETLLNKMTKGGGGVDVVGMMTEGPSDMSMMETGGEKYNYGRGGSYGQASTYSGKKKKKRRKKK